MKILCLSLLRLGDIIQHRQLVLAVMDQHPQSEIHVVCHGQFAQAQDLFEDAGIHFHFLPYVDLQKILVEQRQNPRAAFEMLKEFLMKLKAEEFSLVYDFTHTFLSDAVSKFLAIPAVQKNQLWQTYLEDHATVTQGSRFHLIEILARSLGLEISAVKAQNQREKIIVLQTLTSDQKKNWPLQAFQKLVRLLQATYADYQIQILSSPSEKEQLCAYFPEELLSVTTMKQAQELLRRAAVLVSLDTSLLHLAAQENCPVVGIFLGGADPIKTGPLQDQALILHGKAPCAPCTHSAPCCQERHLCEDFISVDQIFLAVHNILSVQGKGHPMLMNAERVIFKKNAYSLRDVKSSQESLEKNYEEMIWRYYLDGVWQAMPQRFHSQARHFLDENSQASPEMQSRLLQKQKVLASELALCRETLQESMKKISFLCLAHSAQQVDLAYKVQEEMLAKIKNWIERFSEQKDLFHRLQLILQDEVASVFELYRRLKSPFAEFECLVGIRAQLNDQFEIILKTRGQDGKTRQFDI